MKRIVVLSFILLIAVVSGAVLILNQITHAQMPNVNSAAGQVLRNSAIERIDDVFEYTGGPTCYVFSGKDKLGYQMWVFSTDDRVLGSVYASDGISKEKAVDIASKSEPLLTQVIHASPGIVDPTVKTSFSDKASGPYVWELYGIDKNQRYAYVYLDFNKGNVLWTYELKNQN